MNQTKLLLLAEEGLHLRQAASHLEHSMARCADFAVWANFEVEQLERLESLASRFARLSDILIQRVLRLIDEIELTGNSTVLDRIYRAEKRGLANADSLIRIRELRNLIAHEYAADALRDIYAAVIMLSPTLIDAVTKACVLIESIATNSNNAGHLQSISKT